MRVCGGDECGVALSMPTGPIDMAPHDVAAHGPHPARITPQPLRPSPVAHDTHAPVDRLLSEWLCLRTGR
jgi:hypothetical protein